MSGLFCLILGKEGQEFAHSSPFSAVKREASGGSVCPEPAASNHDRVCLSRCRSSATLLEALAAKHRPALRRPEGDGGFLAAMRAGRAGLNLLVAVCRRRANRSCALCLAGFAALGFVLELFVVKEELFASREEKF